AHTPCSLHPISFLHDGDVPDLHSFPTRRSSDLDGIALAANDQSAVLDSLQDALDAGIPVVCFDTGVPDAPEGSVIATIATDNERSEEHTSELQSRFDLVCRLLLEKKKLISMQKT